MCKEIICEPDSNEVMKRKFRAYRNEVHERFTAIFSEGPNETLLLCLDEMQELLGRYPRLFVRNNKICEEAADDEMPQDLFFGVTSASRSILRHCSNWTMYMTGTHLSIAKLKAQKGGTSSLLRNIIEEVPIRHSLLTSREMKGMLQHYWEISDDVFTEPVMEALDKFRGRPYFFVEYVFRHVYVKSCHAALTSDILISLCADCLSTVVSNIHCRIDSMFSQNKAIPDAVDRTATSLIPMLIKSTICGNGSLRLCCDSDISQAIIDGVILASSLDTMANCEINIMETEPLVYDALTCYLSKVPIDRIMHLVLNQTSNESGATAEEMFAYWIALQTHACVTDITKKTKGALLGDLLYPLYDGPNDSLFPKALLNEYVCTATKVVNLDNSAFASALVTGDSAHDIATDTVFFGISSFCGIDIVFVVRNRCDNRPKLVAIKSKNADTITVKDVLVSLSPGLQYLENSYREFVVSGSFPKHVFPKRRTCGPGFAKWDAWRTFCSTYDSTIGNNWIRVALVYRNIAPEIHHFLSADQIVERFDEKMKSVYWRLLSSHIGKASCNANKTKAELARQLSPLVFLSLSAKTWLTEDLRTSFISKRPNDIGVKLPRKGRKSVFWVPVSIAEAEEKLSGIDLLLSVFK